LELLERAGLTINELEPLEGAVPYVKVLALVREIDAYRPGIELGLEMGMGFSLARMAALGCALPHAPTLGVALRDLTRFQQMMNGGLITWHFSAGAGRCTMSLTAHSDLTPIPWLLEAPFAMFITLARKLCGQPIVPLHVSFCHSRRRSNRMHQEFFGAPVFFDAEVTEMVIAASLLEMPVLQADTETYGHLIKCVEKRVDTISGSSTVSDSVRRTIVRTIRYGAPRKASVARQLGMSTRTLLRRLGDEGTTFVAIVEGTRRELAHGYLSDEKFDYTSMATALGYSDSSPFFRAVARWFGCTPSEYRARITPRV
jgi:AraC-like DNA-binding protein